MLNSLGLNDYEQIQPPTKHIKLLESSMSLIQELPPELDVLKNIFVEELSEVIWLKPTNGASELASAAYPEVPGKVFLGRGVFYYIPPFTTFNQLSSYAALENMIHECLHHRGEKLMLKNQNLRECMNSDIELSIHWRGTRWSISHALQAYYIYCWILRLRNWAVTSEICTKQEQEKLKASLGDVHSILQSLEEQLTQASGINLTELNSILLLQ